MVVSRWPAAPCLLVALLAACGGDDAGPLLPTTASGNPTGSPATSGPDDDPSTPTDGGSSSDPGEQPGCDDPSPSLTPQEPSAECVPGVPCVTDANCPDGHACNTALEPPGCALLYCGAAGTPCHDDSVCAQGLQCHEGLCNPCTFCGDLCEVDFATDPAHCGCCGNAVPAGGECVDGAIVCSSGLEMCGESCADLETDPLHCGSCDNAVGPDFACVDGELGCTPSQLLCNDVCINPASDGDHCGQCGASCPHGTCVDSGVCLLEVDDPAVLPTSCKAICMAAGMTCVDTGEQVGDALYSGWCDSFRAPIFSCSQVPFEEDSDKDSFCGFDCPCAIAEQSCHCAPKIF